MIMELTEEMNIFIDYCIAKGLCPISIDKKYIIDEYLNYKKMFISNAQKEENVNKICIFSRYCMCYEQSNLLAGCNGTTGYCANFMALKDAKDICGCDGK